jgi:hypothetical protein
MALPKATVQLQPPTQPLGTSFTSPSQMASTAVDEEEDEDEGDGLANILSGVGLAAALIVLVFQLLAASNWINAPDSTSPGDWMQLMD